MLASYQRAMRMLSAPNRVKLCKRTVPNRQRAAQVGLTCALDPSLPAPPRAYLRALALRHVCRARLCL
jgi:hypothetical protein